MKRILIPAALVACALGALAVGGCSDSTTPGDVPPGRLVLTMIDAPGDYDAVNVHVVRVEVHRGDEGDEGDGGWMVVSEDTMLVDLLTLTDGQGVVLADTLLPAGHFTQVRLILGGGNTVVVGGLEHELEVPSGENTGLKLNHPFDIEPDALYRATLDFDADRSVHRTGNGRYVLEPVIRIVVDRISGGIEGTILPVEARAVVRAVAGADTVTAWADTLTGVFGFPMLEQGAYDLAVEETAGAFRDTVVTGVTVTAGQVTDVGTIELQAE